MQVAQRKAAREAELIGERAAAAALAESLVALRVFVSLIAIPALCLRMIPKGAQLHCYKYGDAFGRARLPNP